MTAAAIIMTSAPTKPTRGKRAPALDPPPVTVDPAASAKAAGLRYVSDVRPGIRRTRSGDGWSYISPDDDAVTDADELQRIKTLAIPPAVIGG